MGHSAAAIWLATHWIIVSIVFGALIAIDIFAFFAFDNDELITWIILRLLIDILLSCIGGSGSDGFGGGDSGGGGSSDDW